MQGNDLSNIIVPRLVVVWENLVGLSPDKRTDAKISRALKRKRWQQAVDLFEVNDVLVRHIWDITMRQSYEFEAVTWLPEQTVEPIEAWLDRHDIPIRRVWNSTPGVLSRSLAYKPAVALVYTPDPEHRFTFGSKGRVISPSDPHLMGAF